MNHRIGCQAAMNQFYNWNDVGFGPVGCNAGLVNFALYVTQRFSVKVGE